jgi:hypothetical protein
MIEQEINHREMGDKIPVKLMIDRVLIVLKFDTNPLLQKYLCVNVASSCRPFIERIGPEMFTKADQPLNPSAFHLKSRRPVDPFSLHSEALRKFCNEIKINIDQEVPWSGIGFVKKLNVFFAKRGLRIILFKGGEMLFSPIHFIVDPNICDNRPF